MENCLDLLESVVALSPGHLYWKNKQNKYLGCNNAQARTLGLASRDEIITQEPYAQLPKEIAEKSRETDQEVLLFGKTVAIEEIGITGNGELGLFFSKKAPLFNSNQEIIGLIGISIDITAEKNLLPLLKNTLTIIRSEKCSIFEFNSQIQSYALTPRESECLFHLLRGRTTKTIARILSVSPCTIAFHLKNLKSKFNCHSKSRLISKAIEKGFLEKTLFLLLRSSSASNS